MTKPVRIWGQYFRIIKIGQVLSKICPGQIWSHWPIFYTILKVVSMGFNKCSCEFSGNVLQNKWKPEFLPILVLFVVKKEREIWPMGPIFYKLLKLVPVSLRRRVSCESSGKLLQNGRKFEILTSFWPFSGKKRPKICPTPVQGLKFKYTWKYLWYACEPSFMFTH